MSVIAQNGHAVVPTDVGFWGKPTSQIPECKA
jgi:hypothetical protein